jgi:succinyl-diaminopimelate desuccinylase
VTPGAAEQPGPAEQSGPIATPGPAEPAGGAVDLLARATELVAIPSVSRNESAIADRVAATLAACPWLAVERVGDNVVARTTGGRAERLLVAGHLDTVPPAANEVPRVERDALWGIGACDMKGGLAVMLDLATTMSHPALDVTWCFYTCEEVARAENGLGLLWDERPELLAADAAVVAEPTDGRVEAGCQGTMRLAVHLGGVRAHVARPFAGRNAIHRLGPLLERVASWAGRQVELDGCTYVEQLQAVLVDGGVATNVVPDHVVLTLNHRYAPDRDAAAAREALAPLFTGIVDPALGDRVEVVDSADGAPPGLGHPVLAALVSRSGAPARAKVAWTDVARIWAHGIPAANFGPGDPLLAHHPDEHVTRSSLEHVRDALRALLDEPDR